MFVSYFACVCGEWVVSQLMTVQSCRTRSWDYVLKQIPGTASRIYFWDSLRISAATKMTYFAFCWLEDQSQAEGRRVLSRPVIPALTGAVQTARPFELLLGLCPWAKEGQKGDAARWLRLQKLGSREMLRKWGPGGDINQLGENIESTFYWVK